MAAELFQDAELLVLQMWVKSTSFSITPKLITSTLSIALRRGFENRVPILGIRIEWG